MYIRIFAQFLGIEGVIMKNFNYCLKLVFIPFIFIISFSILQADDNSINGTCPGEYIEEITGTTTNASYTENGRIGGGGNDRYRMDFPVAGTLTIDVSNRESNRNANYNFYVSRNSCGNNDSDWNIVSAEFGNAHTSTVSVNAGDTIYIRLQSISAEPINGRQGYALALGFTASPPNVCTGTRGLTGDYYNNTTFTTPIVMSRVDSTINFAWGSGSPDASINNDNFSIEWTGTIYIPETASYTFSLAHDDVFELIIDGNTIYNNSTWTGGASNFRDATPVALTAGTYPITIRFVEWGGGAYAKLAWRNDAGIGSQVIVPNENFCTTPLPIVITAVDDSWTTQANTPLSENVLTNDIGTGISVFSVVQPANGSVVMNPDGSFVFTPSTDFVGTVTFTYIISNDGGTTTSEATVSIAVNSNTLNAVNDNYTTEPGVNVDANLFDNDSGTAITLQSNTTPTLGTVVIQANGDFTYTPNSNATGTDTFTYTIVDINGDTDTATVTIVIDTTFTSGSTTPFVLINPPNTRNVIGNYAIAGNTVLCLVNKTSGYGDDNDACLNDILQTSNNRVSKYLDIDGDSGNNGGTWNSTSSNINFSAPYSPTRGVVWAGLFWGGRISSSNTYEIRYAVESTASTFSTIEVGRNGNVGNLDVATTGAVNIKLDIDGGGYADITASRFHTSGQTYAAFADVTSTLQSATLGLGLHTFTVANLTTMEGRESSPGAFGGWSLVVIYAEDYDNGKPRNISIYNGFIDIGTNDNPIEISGFKLPTTGTIDAKLSVFSGEGEYLYGRNTNGNTNEDWMKISDINSNNASDYDDLPGLPDNNNLGNKDNMFDAQLDGILRDITPSYNSLSNNVGVDVDNYDVSDLMTTYRDNDENISTIYIKTYSNNDYVTPSMIAFSAELYVPELCYDYTLDIDGYVLDSVNNEVQTPFGNFGQDLTTVFYVKSLDGDIPLSNVSAVYSINDITHLQYDFANCTTSISETGEYDYSDACAFTYDTTNAGFSMYIGDGKTTTSGGVINALENRYIKFNTEFQKADVSTTFDFSVDYTVDYGSGAVPLRKTFTAADLCEPINGGFFPELGYFNITDSSNTLDVWNLYTQTSGRAFTLKLYAHDANNPTLAIGNDLNLSVEVEMIRADNFNRDANTACNDEHSLLTDVPVKFVQFNQSKEVEFGYLGSEVNLAYRSTAMRVWYLTDVTGNGFLVDDHNCTRNNQNKCVTLYDRDYASGGQCANECKATLSTGNCYDCLRSYYGRKVCSRDNFAIRPESFVTQIIDSNQSEDTTQAQVNIADSTTTSAEFSIVAGYAYRFDINATNHISNNATPRYRQHYSPGSPIHRVSMEWWPDGHTVSNCNDLQDQNISLNIFDGSSVNTYTNTSYVDKLDQIGKYRFSVYDQNWTSADWDDTQMVHHTLVDPLTGLNYADYYNVGDDCIYNSSIVYAEEYPTINPRPGCKISSVHTNEDNGIVYNYLYARYYPYTFDMTGLAVGARPNNVIGDTYVYINTLDQTLYPAGIDRNMSYNIQGTFSAAGYNNDTVSNFVTSCYAEDVAMILRHTYLSAIPTQEPDLRADLIDHNTTNTSLTYPTNNAVTDRRRIIFTNSLTQNVVTPLSITQTENIFVKDMKGSISMDLGYNFDRANNIALNPRRILFNDFNVTYATQPATVYVDLKVDHKIYGQKDLDQNITFVYARAKPNKLFYDDVTSNTITTPISIVAYCDLGLIECQNRGLATLVNGLVNDAQSNESSWWYSQNHSTNVNTDGQVTLTASGGGTVSPSDPTSITTANGIDETITVTNTGPTPNTVNIDFGPNTDRWLIYNQDAATIPSPFYRVRFIGTSGWTGHGQTGHVVGDDINQKKSRRLEW